MAIDSVRSSRVVVTTPEIYRRETTDGQRYSIADVIGRKFLLRSDFPVLVFFGVGAQQRLVAAAGGSYPPWMHFEMPDGAHRSVEFRFPLGFGGDPLGGFAAVAIEMIHGVCVLEGSLDVFPALPNPDALPCASWTGSMVVGAGTAAGLWGTLTIQPGVNEPRVTGITTGANRPPTEMWIKSVSLDAEVAVAPPAAGVYPYELHISKSAQLGGIIDGAEFLTSQQVVHAQTNSYSNFKVPWRSYMKPWAAETPTVLLRIFGSAWGAGGSSFWRVHYAYTV